MADILPVSPSGRRYGRYPDNPAQPARRLYRLAAPSQPLPSKASVVQWMGPIRDQGQEGSCTGQMAAAMRDLLYRKLYQFEKERTVDPSVFMTSAAFIYKCNLIADGNLGNDVGSTIHQSVITLNRKGACQDLTEPYRDTDYSVPPTAVQYSEALKYKGGAYHFLPDLQTMKACLAGDGTPESQYSFGFGINVYESFESHWTLPGMMPMPDVHTEQLLGGHAQHVVAYDDNVRFPDGRTGGLLVQNSWGTGWGISAPGRTDGGCYWMPYDFVSAGLATDAWMIHLGPAWK